MMLCSVENKLMRLENLMAKLDWFRIIIIVDRILTFIIAEVIDLNWH